MEHSLWKILLVDDDEDDYVLVRHMLSETRQGKYILDWAESYDEGWKLLQGERYDVVLMDYDLRTDNGLELTRYAIENGCHIPIILFTGRGSYEVDLEAMQAGATLYLTKGEVSPLMLERSIRYAIEHKQIEEKLIESEARYRTILETLPVGIGIFDTKGRLVESNLLGSQILGDGDQEKQFESTGDIHQEQQGGPNTGAREYFISQVLNGESFSGQEMTLRQADGSSLQILAAGSPVKDSAGKLIGAVMTWTDISERKRLEEELKSSEKRYRELVRYAPAGIYEVDFRGKRFLSVNEAMCELTGYSREELLSMNPFDILDDEGKILFRERINRWLAGETPEKNVEYKVRAKDGHTIYAVINTHFTVDAEGKPLGATVIGFDMTERKRAEEIVKNQHELLEAVIQNTPAAIYLMSGSDLRIEVINHAYQAFAAPDEMVGKTLDEVLPETDRQFVDLCRQVLSTGEPHHVADDLQMVRRSPEGALEPAYFNWSLFRIDLPSEKGWGVLYTAWETTERKQAQEALDRSQRDIRQLVDTSSEGIWFVDQNGRTTFVNQRAAEILGYTIEEIQGKNAFEFLMAGEISAGQQTLAKIIAGESGRVEAHARRKDGSEAVLRVSYSPIFDASGTFQGALAMFSDIPGRKQKV